MYISLRETMKTKIDEHTYVVGWIAERVAYVARVIGFPYLVGVGGTPEGALTEVCRAVAELESTLEDGKQTREFGEEAPGAEEDS